MKKPWKDVKVGDFVHLSNNELVPADLLLLHSSDPQGFAYLDTCNLDGETNLKQRQVVRGFLDLQTCFQPSKFRSIIEVDRPSTKIYRFIIFIQLIKLLLRTRRIKLFLRAILDILFLDLRM
jgi:phospholipid-translocating ATPase